MFVQPAVFSLAILAVAAIRTPIDMSTGDIHEAN
ncbi:Uncharacterised protein [Yersinia intermedia]|uniref:Uncharacterized protein n=1 Tax=Yersinia intermedia TaxID=631 RepID=A0A0T9M8S7_YERIN|nr:Uncharacterised protein [Yersinia intermedia]CNI04193.1 Uncharacterised protein [Yersinia intermedia]CNI13124.1 Uncharacterised protein [Yersinia intermedia]CNJ64172.1 Uncharacterised protein [Yersinia intermedia]CQD81662.1 Uncharacterised protein [Yersinia intermedia]